MIRILIVLDPRAPEALVSRISNDETTLQELFNFKFKKRIRRRIVFRSHFNRNVKLASKFFDLILENSHDSIINHNRLTPSVCLEIPNEGNLVEVINKFITDNNILQNVADKQEYEFESEDIRPLIAYS